MHKGNPRIMMQHACNVANLVCNLSYYNNEVSHHYFKYLGLIYTKIIIIITGELHLFISGLIEDHSCDVQSIM